MKTWLKENWFKVTEILILLGVLFFSGVFSFNSITLATSGACSSHSGVNCSMGRQLNGKVYCNDGWTDSITDYDFTIMCKGNSPQLGCSVEEWDGLLKKYGIDDIYNQMQKIADQLLALAQSYSTDINLANLLLMQHNNLKNQSDTAISLAQIECTALGDIRRADLKQKLEKIESDYNNTQIKEEQERLAKIKEDEQNLQKATQNYNNALKAMSDACLSSNGTVVGTNCICKDGYVYNGNVCITYAQNCQTKYGANSYGDKQYCYCSAGYEWNSSQTTCNKVEIQPIQPLLTPIKPPAPANPFLEAANPPKKEKIQSSSTIKNQEAEKIITNETTTTPSDKKVEGENETQQKQGFLSKVFGSIKGFFSRIFK